jgi:hypothetical protein
VCVCERARACVCVFACLCVCTLFPPQHASDGAVPQFLIRMGKTIVHKSAWFEGIAREHREAILPLTPVGL